MDLIIACRQNNIELVGELLDHWADPNLQTDLGWTALHWASYSDNIGIVRLLLLDHGADPNLRNTDGQTAMHWASIRCSIDVVRELLYHGADPNLQDSDGWNALTYASHGGRTDVVKLLEAACWNRNVAQPLIDLGIFPEGLIREHLTISV
jgi:ankyrin repeat protein